MQNQPGKPDPLKAGAEHPAHMPPRTGRSWIYRILLSTCGLLFVTLGIVGIFLPLLPTTIFLILAAACFIRSSDRLHGWLTQHRILGTYIQFAQGKSGIPLRAKIVTLAVLWATILFSAFYVVSFWWLRALLLTIAVGVSVFILTRPTLVIDPDTQITPDDKTDGDDNNCPQGECYPFVR